MMSVKMALVSLLLGAITTRICEILVFISPNVFEVLQIYIVPDIRILVLTMFILICRYFFEVMADIIDVWNGKGKIYDYFRQLAINASTYLVTAACYCVLLFFVTAVSNLNDVYFFIVPTMTGAFIFFEIFRVANCLKRIGFKKLATILNNIIKQRIQSPPNV